MFRHLLTAAVAAAGFGVAGTAETAQARDRHHDHHGGHHDRHHDRHFDRGHHHGHYHGHHNRFRIQPYPYYGRSGFGRGYYGGPGFYGRPYYGGSGFYIGTNRFQLGVFR